MADEDVTRRRETQPGPQKERGCQQCEHFSTGHLDNRVSWLSCARGRRLIPEESYIHTHHPYGDPDEPAVRVTADGWTGGHGTGEAMLERRDCPDWRERGSRLDLGNPEYD